MIFVLSHSHGANFTKQQMRNMSSAGKVIALAQRGRPRRHSIQQSAATATGSRPKFVNQNFTNSTGPGFSCIQPGFQPMTDAPFNIPVTSSVSSVAGASAAPTKISSRFRDGSWMRNQQPSTKDRKMKLCRWKTGIDA